MIKKRFLTPRSSCSVTHRQEAWCTLPLAHLALVDGDGPGQFEGQLLATQVDPTTRFEHPALGLQHFSDAAQETHTRMSWGGRARKRVCVLKTQNLFARTDESACQTKDAAKISHVQQRDWNLSNQRLSIDVSHASRCRSVQPCMAAALRRAVF